MFDALRTMVLRLLRVPHEPTPPAGAAGSIRIFRAGTNFYKLRLVRWAIAQLGALVGIVISLNVLVQVERSIDDLRDDPGARVSASAATRDSAAAAEATPQSPAPTKAKGVARNERSKAAARNVAKRWPWWVFPLLKVIEAIGILLYVVQIPITYAMARLDYELRWYIVTDRSLRIRSGLGSVQELTMSFANVQQVVVSQGPLQRLLAIADVRVQSAGGGGDAHRRAASETMHSGVFHGVDNASEIRDLILERLRLFRAAGLGDPDDVSDTRSDAPGSTPNASALAAVEEVLSEARALRSVVR